MESIPKGTYKAVYADPPWSFRTWSKKNQTRAAENHYPVMRIEDIYALPVAEIADRDSVLFLWSINSMLPQAMTCIERWGFSFKTVAFTWAKRAPRNGNWHMGLGYWTRQNTERVLLATRGKPKRLSRAVRELVEAPRGAHSEKPPEVHERIEALVAGPYIELFARRCRPGWDSYGNEIGGFVPRGTLPLFGEDIST